MNPNLPADHDAACLHLGACDPAFAALIARIGACRLIVAARDPYEALIRAIAH